MKTEEFDRDIGIMKSRYAFVEKACAAEFPESVKLLRELTNDWLPNEDWLNSPILLWSLTRQMTERGISLANLNAHLGLAAVKRWRIEHGGKSPKNLAEAVGEAGIKDPLVDPFSGKSLKYRSTKSKAEVYSVGFNGKDDAPKRIPMNARHQNHEALTSMGGEPVKLLEGNMYYALKFTDK